MKKYAFKKFFKGITPQLYLSLKTDEYAEEFCKARNIEYFSDLKLFEILLELPAILSPTIHAKCFGYLIINSCSEDIPNLIICEDFKKLHKFELKQISSTVGSILEGSPYTTLAKPKDSPDIVTTALLNNWICSPELEDAIELDTLIFDYFIQRADEILYKETGTLNNICGVIPSKNGYNVVNISMLIKEKRYTIKFYFSERWQEISVLSDIPENEMPDEDINALVRKISAIEIGNANDLLDVDITRE